MKKILVVILMLITTAGMFIPCCSVDDCCGDRVSNSSNQDKHQDEGSCSPFFTCASCPGSVELASFIELDFPPFEKLVHYQGYLKMQPSDIRSSFWQPPRA